jgi:DnaJ family protein C protein 7
MSQINNHQPTPMDIDREVSSSPAQQQQQQPNGTSSHDQDARPAPPPHRYTTSPPPQSANYAATPEAAATTPVQAPTIDAEEYKAAGNKFFKIKDYPQAIKEYSKGAYCSYISFGEPGAALHKTPHCTLTHCTYPS